jgi:hypothetical protein
MTSQEYRITVQRFKGGEKKVIPFPAIEVAKDFAHIS